MSEEIEATEVEEEETPHQTVRLEAPEATGPFFPSGMNTVEAAGAGATADMSEEAKASLNIGGGSGEETEEEEEEV